MGNEVVRNEATAYCLRMTRHRDAGIRLGSVAVSLKTPPISSAMRQFLTSMLGPFLGYGER